ncbi:regulator of microtubule dynamics protein 2 isoform 1-T8 [Molossus nigricans]
MSHSANKELILGIMVGITGISLLLLWYHKVRKPSTAMNLPKFLSLGNAYDSMTLQDEMHNDQGRQLQILEKLNELLTNMEELKEEIRVLKETIPKLEEYVHGELGGKTATHRISPQHRARKRRLATVHSSGTSNSSEEAESEGGCFTEDQRLQPECPADHVTPDPLHHEASWVSHPDISFGFKTNCPTIRIVSLPKGSKNSSSNTSIHSSSSGRSHSLLSRFHKSGASLHCQQSRANFDPEEKSIMSDLKCPSEHLIYRSRKHFSTPKLSIISCYESAMFYDPQSSSDIRFNPTEMESISKSSSIADAEKYINSCSPDYNIKHFMNFETKVNSSATRNSVGSDIYQPSTVTFLTIPSLVSYSYQQNEFATDTQERSQLRKDSLYSGSQSHSTDRSPAMIQQHPSQSVTSVPHNVGSSLFYKHTRSFTNTRIK